jgi:hypothetical protein
MTIIHHRYDYTYCTVQDFNYAKKGAPDSNLDTEEEAAAAPGGQAAAVNRTGSLYEELLLDLDQLLATDSAFMLGPWLDSARALGANATDCTDTIIGDGLIKDCADFMEWNARSQLTTWQPTPKVGPLGNPQDYARKHWSGLIKSYYAPRVRL